MAKASLVLVKSPNGRQVLLARRKTGELGKGKLNGPGGKLGIEDSDLKSCATRETFEEWGIILDRNRLDEVAVLHCYVSEVLDFEVHVFLTDFFFGAPAESEATEKPEWYDIDSLPFEEMHESDEFWMMSALHGKKFEADIFYERRGEGFQLMSLRPYGDDPNEELPF
jgi:8-oxo-dGTP diphosphatase